MITDNETFKESKSKLIVSIIGGSLLYGLNTPESDYDQRGIFTSTEKKYVTGFRTLESIVLTNGVDATYYELNRYLKLLRKSNTQVLEILFAPSTSFIYKHDFFDIIVDNRFKLIDSELLKNSLKGYVFSELKLATGQRSGQLGGKRKEAVGKYGFSPKNFVQILRLCKVGSVFFDNSEYMVKVSDYDTEYHNFLMDVKVNPQNYTCEQLQSICMEKYQDLCNSISNSKISYKFDEDLASDIILEAREIFKN